MLFLGSCQELEQVEPIVEEGVDSSFDRAKFLSAVNKVSIQYRGEPNDPMKSKNFRTLFESNLVILNYIDDIASEFNNSEYFFRTIPEESWNDPFNNQTFSNLEILNKSSIPNTLGRHVQNFENSINMVAERYENGWISDNQLKLELKNLCKDTGNSIKFDNFLPINERIEFSEIFYAMDEITEDIYLLLQDPSFDNGFIRTRIGRALARVLLVAAITAAVVYTAGLAAGAIKMGSVAAGHKAGIAALTTKTTILGGKMYSALFYGLGKGMIGAVQKWDEKWKGLGQESIYAAVKVAW